MSSPATGTIQAKASASAAAGPHNSMSNLLFVVVLFRARVEGETGEGKKKKIPSAGEASHFAFQSQKRLPLAPGRCRGKLKTQ